MPIEASPLLDSLRKALDYVEKVAIPPPSTLPERIAAGAMRRLPSLLRAILGLLEDEAISVTEVDVLIRVVLEMAITTAWVRKDEGRAGQFRDAGIEMARKWRSAMEKDGFVLPDDARRAFDAFLAEGSGASNMPDLSTRALKVGQNYAESYDFSYRRLSTAVHHDYRLQSLLERTATERSRWFTVHEAVASTMFLLGPAVLVLGLEDGEQIVVGLQRALAASLGKPSPL